MPLSPSVIGTDIITVSLLVERGRLAFFAEATGQADPIYSDVSAARAAGHRDLPVPPTFLFGLKLDVPAPFQWMLDLGVDLRFVLHGTQRFTYSSLAYAGDTLTFVSRIANVFDKRGGALEFLVVETAVTRDGEPIAVLEETIVVRHPELEAAR